MNGIEAAGDRERPRTQLVGKVNDEVPRFERLPVEMWTCELLGAERRRQR
ncbi:MAG TPA: hypothetical protein VJ596_10340 [Gemmatimonadaceae bacterium]|nr:hypothetical protein [Gemmatimonadaceae bacterium]